MRYKEDWEMTRAHYEAFFAGENIGRPLLQITAPRLGKSQASEWNWWAWVHHLQHPEQALVSFDNYCRCTFFGAEAIPNLPINMGAGSLGGYLNCTPRIMPDTVWFEEQKLESWDEICQLQIDPQNEWWLKTVEFTRLAIEFGQDKFITGMTDLNGIMNILAFLRGNQRLLIDLFEFPTAIQAAAQHLTTLWFACYDSLLNRLQAVYPGTTTWMDVWFPGRGSDVQCDFSALISPPMFEKFVLPHLQVQCQRLDHSIYHWDGPGQIGHLDYLLEIPELDGFQWVPGAGQPGTGDLKWLPLYRRIQARGKLLVLQWMDKNCVEQIVRRLSPQGLLIHTQCASEAEARDLIRKVEAWSKPAAHLS